MADASSIASAANGRNVIRDIFSASCGSICCCYVGQPLDTVKVRMQTSPNVYPTLFSSLGSVVKNEGIPALWKGSVPTAMGMMAENAVAFVVYEFLKRAFPYQKKEENKLEAPPSLVRPFLMGAITGCFSSSVLLPSEVVKAKTQVIVGTSQSSTDVIKKMIQSQGLKSLFCGLDAQLARDSSFYAFFFGSYEMSCYLFRTYCPSMPDELNYFISGGLAGMFGWTVAMPFDVPKTNVQSRWDTRVLGSYFPEMVKIARTRGVMGFYSGLGPTLVRAFPANAALFLGVESAKKFFDNLLWP